MEDKPIQTERIDSFPLGDLFDKPVQVSDWLRKISAPNLIAQKKAFGGTKFCVSPNCTDRNFSWCHVIPSSAQLSKISQNGEVCWIPMREEDRYTLRSWWSQDPISKTLVFRGFCNACDSSLFEKIDQSLQLDDETYLLLAYRAACYSHWRAEVDLRSIELAPSEIRKMVEGDTSLPPLRTDFEKAYATPTREAKRHRDESSKRMDSLRDNIDASNYDCLTTEVFDFGRRLPYRYSVAASFTTSLRHEHIYVSQEECPPTPSVYLHLLNVESTTKLILSWPNYVPDKFPNTWLTQLMQFSESGHLADVLLRYMFIFNHGLVFDPSVVPKLRHEQSAFLTSPLATSYYHGDKPEITRICEPPYFDHNWKLLPVTGKT